MSVASDYFAACSFAWDIDFEIAEKLPRDKRTDFLVCVMYAKGIIDASAQYSNLIEAFVEKSSVRVEMCVPDDADMWQIMRITRDYLKANPGQGNNPLFLIVWAASDTAWCPQGELE